MHKINNYEQFLTADLGQLYDANLEEFKSIFSEHFFNEITTTNTFSDINFYSILSFTVNGFQNQNTLNGLSWIPLPYTFNIYSLVSNNNFSNLRIGKVSGIWFSGEYAENIWTKKTKTTTSWEVK